MMQIAKSAGLGDLSGLMENNQVFLITRETTSCFKQNEQSSYITRAARSARGHFRQLRMKFLYNWLKAD
jgi:hypothetical protein